MKIDFYKKTINEALYLLNTNTNGLNQKEINERVLEAKKIEIKPAKKDSFIKKIVKQLTDLMVMVLLFASIISIVVGIVDGEKSEIVDGAIILAIVVANALFGVLQEKKSEKAIENLKKITQPETQVLRDGVIYKIKAKDLVEGDIVLIEAGSIVPADIRLIECLNLKINESMITGESEATEKNCDVVYNKNIGIGDRKNIAYAGSVVESGRGKGVVFGLGTESEIGKITQKLNRSKEELTPLQKNIRQIGKVLTYIILLMATVTFVLEAISNPQNILEAFLTAVAISVAAIPESMPAVITVIMSMGVAKLAKQKAIIKKMYAVETLGACDVICSDKTGTITQNKMKVSKIFTLFSQKSIYKQIFIQNCVLCNNVKCGKDGYVGSSTEVALAEYAKSNLVDIENTQKEFERLQEIAFDSKRKMMTTLNVYKDKTMVCVKGALDRILQKCKYVALEDEIVEFDEKKKLQIFEANKQFCEEGLRVIGFAFKFQFQNRIEENDLVFLGICGIQDPPRPKLEQAVEKCKTAHIRTVMITGDYKDTALAIAKKVGIAKSMKEVLSGEEIDKLSDQEFLKIVENINVFARVNPMHKERIVEALKKNGHIVAMTGDGINDALSLKKADIGIGMGKTGADVAKDVSDMIIADDNFSTIVVAVEEGRKVYSNIQKTIKYLFSANMAEILSLFLITILFPGKTFLLPVQILFVNLITDSLPAIALGTETIEKVEMSEKPRKRNENLFSNGVGVEIFVLGAIQTLLTMIAYVVGYKVYGEHIAITMAFYTLNFIQLFYMFTARTKEMSFKTNPFKNKFFNLSLVAGFGILAIIALTSLKSVLSLQPLKPICWIIVLILSSSIIFIGELYKIIYKKVKHKNCIKK